MGYVYDSSSRSYRATGTTATKAVTSVARAAAKVYSKPGSQVAPTSGFYQSATKVTVSTQAQKLASGVRTSIDTVLTKPASSLPSATVYLERTVTAGNAAVKLTGFDVLNGLSANELTTLKQAASTSTNYGDSILSLRIPAGASTKLDMATAARIGGILLGKLDGSFSFEVANADLSDSAKASVLRDVRNTIGRRLSSLTFADGATSASLQAAAVSNLGPDAWAKYSGTLTVNDSVENITAKAGWNDLRVLNNLRNYTLNVPDGIPAGTTPADDLSKFDFALDYQSFVSGYSLLKTINRQAAQVTFAPDLQNNSASVQSFGVTGKLLNRDHFSVSLTYAGAAMTLPLSPLTIPPSARTEDRVKILAAAIQDAINAKPALQGVTVSRSGNSISLSSPSADFSGQIGVNLIEAGENDTASFVDVKDVPIYGLSGLKNLPEIRSISVATNFDSLRANWDSMSAFNALKPLDHINVAGSGDLTLTAQELKKYAPIIEKIDGRQFRITDAPFAISTYATLTANGAEKLAIGVDLTGSVADFAKAAAGIAALSNAGKLRSITLTDAASSVISLDSKTAISLADSLSTLSSSATIRITDKPSLADAVRLANSALASRLDGTFAVETNGSDITAQAMSDLAGIDNHISSIAVTKPVSLERALLVTARSFTLATPIKVEDSAANVLSIIQGQPLAASDVRGLHSVIVDDAMTASDGIALNGSALAPKLLSGVKISDSAVNVDDAQIITGLQAMRAAGRLREIAVTNMTAALATRLQAAGLSSFLV